MLKSHLRQYVLTIHMYQYAVVGFADWKLDCTDIHKIQFAHNRSFDYDAGNSVVFYEPFAAIRTIHMSYKIQLNCPLYIVNDQLCATCYNVCAFRYNLISGRRNCAFHYSTNNPMRTTSSLFRRKTLSFIEPIGDGVRKIVSYASFRCYIFKAWIEFPEQMNC